MKLSDLRTEQPLRDADFAAIRARVLSKIAERERRRWVPLLWWVGAAAAIVVVAMVLFPRREVTLPVNPPPQVVSSGGRAYRPPATDVPSVATPKAVSETLTASGRDARPPQASARRRPIEKPPAERVSRIEIHTADPSIRIIWIVKEKS
jgi:hypothetical protein